MDRPVRALLCAAVALAFTRCGPQGQTVEATRPPETPVAPVAKASKQGLARSVQLTAEFRPYQEVELHAKVAGFLKEITVDAGSRVKPGQLIATLEIPEQQQDVTRAVAARKRAQADVIRARDELGRAEAAHAIAHLSAERLAGVAKTRPNLLAQQEVDEAQARDRIAEAQIAAARSALASAEQQTAVSAADESRTETLAAYSRITAPFAGVITRRYADVGAMIQAGTASQSQAMPVVRLSDDSRLRLVVPVPESAVSRIRQGSEVEVTVSALAKSFRGRVARSSTKLSMSTRTMDVEIDVPNPGFQLVPGMFANVSVTLDERPNAIAVPVQAIAVAQGKTTVYRLNEGGKVEEVAVETGIETPALVEVVRGLNEGDLVILGSRARFRPGEKALPKLAGGKG